jgi:cysteine desulfurase
MRAIAVMREYSVMVYMDHAAGTPMRPGVWEAMAPYAGDHFGNPSGVHGVSRTAKNALEEAREQIAALIGARPMEIVLTAGGTESDNLALKGAALNGSDRRGLITSAIEHEAVLETADFLERLGMPVTIVGVDSEGRVDADAVGGVVEPDTAVVSVMMVNNETGSVQDLPAIVAAVKRSNPETLFHTDAVQAFGDETIDVDSLGVDLLTISAHKFGGPKGAGALYVREGTALEPVIHGGGQELGRRSGTNDVASAVGMATAVRLACADRERFGSEIRGIRDRFEETLATSLPDIVVNTPQKGRSSHHLNVRFPGVRNETLLMLLDRRGVCASAGSACQSGAATVSHVLEAMGLTPEQARESVRFSFGWSSTLEEADEGAGIVIDLVSRLSR